MKHSKSEKLVKAIHRKAHRKYLAHEKIRIVLKCLRGEESTVRGYPLSLWQESQGAPNHLKYCISRNKIIQHKAGDII